jgi:uncharacterized repeat protein (TIGR03803 family)
MKLLITAITAAILPLTGLRAGQYFYQTDFDGPLNQIGQPPTTDFGNSNQPAFLGGTPVIVASFDQITNQALLLHGSATDYQFDSMGFFLSRGASNYFIDFDFETHNLSTSALQFAVAFPSAQIRLQGSGTLQFSSLYSQTYQIGWKDDHLHHLHLELNKTDATWSFQLDSAPPLTGTYDPSGDEFQVDFVLLGDFPGDPTVQVAIDNLRIGTTNDLFPLDTLHWFSINDGSQPRCRLVYDGRGAFYGTTQMVGPNYTNNYQTFGTVFKANTNGGIDWVFPFYGTNGSTPLAGVTLGTDGDLYGTTSQGGDYGNGTAFKITTNGALVWSVSLTGSNGLQPTRELVEARGVFYGTMQTGGDYGMGTLFSLTPDGNIATLHAFTGGTDGGQPLCRMLQAKDGDLYGTTFTGGSAPTGAGTVFRFKRNGKLTTLASFDGTNGLSPRAGLIEVGDGSFYGTTPGGGTFDSGTVFKVAKNGRLTVLHSFGGWEDGAGPAAELVRAKDGNLYGTTISGGLHNIFSEYGTLFRISLNGDFKLLTWFHGGDGSFPESAMVSGPGDKLYGTTIGGYFSPGNIYYISAGRPCLIITSPAQNAWLRSPTVQISGRTKADPPITNVLYQLNGGLWRQASTTDNWATWTATATLKPGTNTISAYAINQTGMLSRTNTVTCSFLARTF